MVQWGEVPAVDQNGIILSYTVTYKALPNGIELTKNVTAPTTEATLRGLNKYTNYSIAVFAVTAVGGGNTSKPIIVITDEDSKFIEVALILVGIDLWPLLTVNSERKAVWLHKLYF